MSTAKVSFMKEIMIKIMKKHLGACYNEHYLPKKGRLTPWKRLSICSLRPKYQKTS